MAFTEQTPLRSGFPTSSGTFEPSEGLSSQEAANRLATDGRNKLELGEEEPFLSILLTQMKSTIFLLTAMAAVVGHAMGERVKPYILIGLVVFVCLAKAWGEYSGQDAGQALASMTAANAIVLRDGQDITIDHEELVVGDVVKLEIGDMVPADMVVLESLDLRVDEALLTGEPHEQRKTVEPSCKKSAFPSNMLYKGTSVQGGRGKGEVVAIGMKTQVGLIAKRLKDDEFKQLSPLQESINTLGTLIGVLCVGVVFISTGIAYATKFNDPAHPCLDRSGNCLLLSSIERGLMMAVSVIPHGLPFVVMVMLQVGAKEMKARNALLTRQSAVDYIGATTVICTDKTGTLTEGKMTAKRLLGLCAKDDSSCEDSSLAFCPLRGSSPNGGLFLNADLSPEASRRIEASYDPQTRRQTFAEDGLADFGDLSVAQDTMHARLARAHLACGFLTCHAARLIQSDTLGTWTTEGNMTEAAIKVSAAKGGYWNDEGPGKDLIATFPRIDDLEVPFDSKKKMMATVHELPASLSSKPALESLQLKEGTTHIAILKGAPDRIIRKLKQVPCSDGQAIQVPGRQLSESERIKLENWNSDLAREALRSLLLAVCTLSGEAVAALRREPDADSRLAFLLDHPDLCFLSLWGIYDPPRAMVQSSVQECSEAGVRVVMITGDQHDTAVAIGRQVGILADGDSDAFHAAECAELQTGAPPKPDTRRLSKRASELVANADLVLQQQKLLAYSEKRPSVSSQVADPRRGSRAFSGHRRLSVHDTRTQKDMHEPTYKPVDELAELTSHVRVWARAQPTDKVAIVESLARQDHITVMTGDGVNDAPALKHAHTGVAMGISGTEVTKNASSLVLLDDDFSTIVAAIREGRRIYANTQKYLLFNFCVKEGELCCVLFAIIARLPLPIQGLQQLVNLICTHVFPPLVLAYEAPEANLMRVPPRDTKNDLILTRSMMLYRWVPFIMCMPALVLTSMSLGVWLHTGFITAPALIGSSKVGALDKGLVACEFAGTLDGDGKFISDPAPFHCKCHNKLDNVDVDQWGRSDLLEQDLSSKFDPWTGHAGSVYNKDASVWAHGVEQLLKKCLDEDSVEHWCWKQEEAASNSRPVLSADHHCAASGTRFGETMGYASIQLGEILSLMSFRTDGSALANLFSNRLYICSVIFNFGALATFLYVPRVAGMLRFVPLNAAKLGIAVGCAIAMVMLNEFTKWIYMSKLEAEQKRSESLADDTKAAGGCAQALASETYDCGEDPSLV